jgi:hypothetical protein
MSTTIANPIGEPEDQTGRAHQGGAPQDGPVVELLPVGELIVFRERALAEEPEHLLPELLHVPRLRHHGGRSPEDAPLPFHERAPEHVHHVIDHGPQQDRAHQPVHETGALEPAEQRRQQARPRCIAEQQRQSCRRQRQKGGHDDDVQRARRGIEAADVRAEHGQAGYSSRVAGRSHSCGAHDCSPPLRHDRRNHNALCSPKKPKQPAIRTV